MVDRCRSRGEWCRSEEVLRGAWSCWWWFVVMMEEVMPVDVCQRWTGGHPCRKVAQHLALGKDREVRLAGLA